ncbi:MAG: tetratricopeptide repeat protein, partial [Isosphaeraceae bacterium]
AYNARGAIWHIKREYDKAIADYDEAIRIDPKHARAYNNRGLAWYARGDYGKAIADHTEAARLDSKYAIAPTYRGTASRPKEEGKIPRR